MTFASTARPGESHRQKGGKNPLPLADRLKGEASQGLQFKLSIRRRQNES
jgi:hypothetical protein